MQFTAPPQPRPVIAVLTTASRQVISAAQTYSRSVPSSKC